MSGPDGSNGVDRRRELGSVANALRMVEALSGVSDAGVTELARELGISKATVSRLLATLMSAGFVEQDSESRRYNLSLKIAVLAESVRSRTGVVELARVYLRGLADRVGETVNLGVLLDGALVYADTIPSRHVLGIETRPGSALPAYCTGAGKVLLAHLSPVQLSEYLGALVPVQHTRATLTSTAAIRDELDRVRRAGHALDRGELLEEAWCAAAPISGRDRVVLAAVSVSAPRSHFAAKHDELIAEVTSVAADVSRRAHELGVTTSSVAGR
jgi:DNA-binding IclR family transcriptional regulator